MKRLLLIIFVSNVFLSCSGSSNKSDSIIEDSIHVIEKSDENYRQALREHIDDIVATNKSEKLKYEKAEEKRAMEEKIRNSKKVYNVFISTSLGSDINNATTNHGSVELWGHGARATEVRLVDFVPQGKVYILDYVELEKSNSYSIFSECIGIGQPGKYIDKKWVFGKQKDYIIVRVGNYFSMILNPCRYGEANYTIGFIIKDESEVW